MLKKLGSVIFDKSIPPCQKIDKILEPYLIYLAEYTGANTEQMAKMLGISERTIRSYSYRLPGFKSILDEIRQTKWKNTNYQEDL